MGCHADVILLIGGGGDGIDAAGGGDRLVLRYQRRGGDLRDHESGIHAAVLDQECGQAAHLGVDQYGHSALRQAADFRNRQRQSIGCEGHGLGVEIAAGEHVARLDEQQRVVRDRVGLDPSVTLQWRIRSRHAPMTCGWQRKE
jgi:hypothetical protein